MATTFLFDPNNSTPPIFGQSSASLSLSNLLAERVVLDINLTLGKPGDQRDPDQIYDSGSYLDCWMPAYFYKDVINSGTIANGYATVDCNTGTGVCNVDLTTIILLGSNGVPPNPVAMTRTGDKKYFAFSNIQATTTLLLPTSDGTATGDAGNYEGQELVVLAAGGGDLENVGFNGTPANGTQGWYRPDGANPGNVGNNQSFSFVAMTIPAISTSRQWYRVATDT